MTLAALTDLGSVLMIAGGLLAVLIVVFMVGSRRELLRRAPAMDPHEKLERIRQSGAVKDELRETMRELEALARRINSELDEKTRRLEKLLAQADDKIAALKRDPADAASPQDPIDDEPTLDPIAVKVYELTDAGRKPLEIARELGEHIGKVELILALRQPVR